MMRPLLFAALLALLAATARAETSPDADNAPDKRPNFIIFLVDDVGYADVGCFGAVGFKTPHLDRMAAEGVKFTDFYVHPVCGVTRAALMTGCYAMRVAELGNRKFGHPILHSREITIAEGTVQQVRGSKITASFKPVASAEQGPEARDPVYVILEGK